MAFRRILRALGLQIDAALCLDPPAESTATTEPIKARVVLFRGCPPGAQ